jgi:Family of unknown function (DUF5923)
MRSIKVWRRLTTGKLTTNEQVTQFLAAIRESRDMEGLMIVVHPHTRKCWEDFKDLSTKIATMLEEKNPNHELQEMIYNSRSAVKVEVPPQGCS